MSAISATPTTRTQRQSAQGIIRQMRNSAKEGRSHRGNRGPFGMGRTSKSSATFAAAWKPCIEWQHTVSLSLSCLRYHRHRTNAPRSNPRHWLHRVPAAKTAVPPCESGSRSAASHSRSQVRSPNFATRTCATGPATEVVAQQGRRPTSAVV